MKRFLYLSLAALMTLTVSCKKDSKVGTPSVKTLEAMEIGPESARLNAKIDFADVSYASVNFGFYWGTSENQEGTYIQGAYFQEKGGLTDNSLYSAVITGLTPETEYWFKAYIEIDDGPYTGEILNFTTAVSPIPEEAVDLGIEMTREDGTTYKLYWAKSNLCETGLCADPEDYGDYYAWGETEPYYVAGHSQDNPCESWRVREDHPITGYNWKSYKWCDGAFDKMTKYCINASYGVNDGLTELQRGEKPGETVDDAARHVLGGKWRTPTEAEWRALMEKCTLLWRTKADGYNHIGCLVTSMSNGNSIFLPAAGCRFETFLQTVGPYVEYMSSSICGSMSERIWMFYGYETLQVHYQDRFFGFSVRPVWEE